MELLIGYMKKNSIAGMGLDGVTDSQNIAYWQIDGKNTKDYLMLNTTDSIYPKGHSC